MLEKRYRLVDLTRKGIVLLTSRVEIINKVNIEICQRVCEVILNGVRYWAE